jgi:hypothetical protein
MSRNMLLSVEPKGQRLLYTKELALTFSATTQLSESVDGRNLAPPYITCIIAPRAPFLILGVCRCLGLMQVVQDFCELNP